MWKFRFLKRKGEIVKKAKPPRPIQPIYPDVLEAYVPMPPLPAGLDYTLESKEAPEVPLVGEPDSETIETTEEELERLVIHKSANWRDEFEKPEDIYKELRRVERETLKRGKIAVKYKQNLQKLRTINDLLRRQNIDLKRENRLLRADNRYLSMQKDKSMRIASQRGLEERRLDMAGVRGIPKWHGFMRIAWIIMIVSVFSLAIFFIANMALGFVWASLLTLICIFAFAFRRVREAIIPDVFE